MRVVFDELKINYKGCLVRFICVVIMTVAIYYMVNYCSLHSWDNDESMVVEVLDIGPEHVLETEKDAEQEEPFRTVETEVALRLMSGKRTGETIALTVTQMEGSGVEIMRGHRYILMDDEFSDGSVQYSIADAFRIPSVVAVIIFACGMLVVFTGRNGIKVLWGLFISIIFLLWVYVPMVAGGFSPVPLAFLSVTVIAFATVLCVVRNRRVRVTALLGTLGGTLIAFVLGYLMVVFWHLSGLSGENASLLASTMPGLNIRGILLSSIIISAIGAVLDVGISITASMSELLDYDASIPPLRLWISGIRVGGEVMGSMVNTLILAYVGTSLFMCILISNAGVNWMGLLNDPYVGQEIAQSIAGTAGLLFTIPITAAFFILQNKLLPNVKQKDRCNDE